MKKLFKKDYIIKSLALCNDKRNDATNVEFQKLDYLRLLIQKNKILFRKYCKTNYVNSITYMFSSNLSEDIKSNLAEIGKLLQTRTSFIQQEDVEIFSEIYYIYHSQDIHNIQLPDSLVSYYQHMLKIIEAESR